MSTYTVYTQQCKRMQPEACGVVMLATQFPSLHLNVWLAVRSVTRERAIEP